MADTSLGPTLEPTLEPTLVLNPVVNPVEEDPVIELGDRVRLVGGKYDGTIGRIVRRTEDELDLMPDGFTHKVETFALTDEGFDEESGVEAVEILQKRKQPSLASILDLRPSQILETFTADGSPGSVFTILSVDPATDSILISNDELGESTLSFNFRGIPKDMGFTIVRGREVPEKPIGQELSEESEQTQESQESEEGEGPELENFDYLDDELEVTPAEGVELLIEIPSSERTYSDITQKSEAYADILSMNSEVLQKIESTQKFTRILVELFFNISRHVLNISPEGNIKGFKPSSIQTLIDLLQTRKLTLARPVIDATKILYYDDTTSEAPTVDHIMFKEFEKNLTDSNNYLTGSALMDSQKFTAFLNGYLSMFTSQWVSESKPKIAFERDEEVFRLKEPDDEKEIPGYPRQLPTARKGLLSPDVISTVKLSLLRGLKAIRAKGRINQSGDEASVLSYVLFPYMYQKSLTTLRTESLAKDIEYGRKQYMSMNEIVTKVGEITSIPSSDSAFSIGLNKGNMGNMSLVEYIKILNVKGEGLGDFWQLQLLLGLADREWTLDQYATLKTAMNTTQNAIVDLILKQREALATFASQPPPVEGIQMTPDGPIMIKKIAEEGTLKEMQTSLQEQMPSYKDSDVALVGLMIRQHPDYTFAQLAEQPVALAKLRLTYGRREYLRGVNNKLKYMERVEFAGEPPVPIHCPHVKPLAMIRRVKDTKQRLSLMAKFLSNFQGVKEDNWVRCRIGDHHLLCVHELLQIYQFLRPGDVDALNKDIQLNFGGGQFQGHYICRNCGQPISELEYDTHLEFNDDGVPMSGRSELVDKDALTMSDIDKILGPMGDADQDSLPFTDTLSPVLYGAAKELADRLYVAIDREDLIKVVNRSRTIINQLPTLAAYIAANKKAPVEKITGDHATIVNQTIVCTIGIHVLIAIQTHMPDYTMRRTKQGCQNLGGAPLQEEGNSGIECIISTLASINKDAGPWNLTGYQTLKDEQRLKFIGQRIEAIMKEVLKDPIISQDLNKKRSYLKGLLGMAGKQGRPDEVVPASFAPIPFIMEARDFVEKIIVPEAASKRDLVELWIRQGNFLAKTHKLARPASFSETSCCLSPLNDISEFWKKSDIQQSLPVFEELMGLEAPSKLTRTEPTMTPPKIYRPLPDSPEESYYLLFMKVCHGGPKKGQAHEFGLTHKCIWCDLELPKDANVLTAAQGLSALEAQGIDVNKESFNDLLDETHRMNLFTTKLLLEIPGPLDNWMKLMAIRPEPVDGFYGVMEKTQAELLKLPPDADSSAIAAALREFANLAEACQDKVKVRLGKQVENLEGLIDQGPETIIRFLQSYVIVPLKRFLERDTFILDTDGLIKFGLSVLHMFGEDEKSGLTGMLRAHSEYPREFDKQELTPWLKAKFDSVILQGRLMIDQLSLIRPIQLPGGDQTYYYFLKICLFSALGNFVDPDTLPITDAPEDQVPPDTQVQNAAIFPARFISDMVKKFFKESLNLTPEKIRENIARIAEDEKANIISKMNKMKGIEKQIEKMHIKHGTGKYAVGGTKAIYAYDPEQFAREFKERRDAGIIDFPGFAEEQPKLDALGFAVGGDEEGYLGEHDVQEANGFDED